MFFKKNSFINLYRGICLMVTRSPGATIFQHAMNLEKAHGSIWVKPFRSNDPTLRIPFKCENPGCLASDSKGAREDILRQARQAGYEPLFISMNGKGCVYEHTVTNVPVRSAA